MACRRVLICGLRHWVVVGLTLAAGTCLGAAGGGSTEQHDEASALPEEMGKKRDTRSASAKGKGGDKVGRPSRLIIADDHLLVRAGTRALLEGEPDLVVVAEAENGQQALELARVHEPDLVLMDVRMPVMDGLEATRALKGMLPETSVLVVTTHENQDYLLEAIRAGAAGYVLKEATKSELLKAVRGVLGGDLPFQGKLAARLLKRLAEETAAKPPAAQATGGAAEEVREKGKAPPAALRGVLTPRELDILRLIAAGKTNREIASELVISLSTVKTHVQRIISKLEVSDRTQAAVKAVELGLYGE